MKIHVLVIPKGMYIDLDDFNNNASDKEIVELNKAITHVSNIIGAKGKGYRDSGIVAVQLAEEGIQVNGAQLDKEIILHLAEKI